MPKFARVRAKNLITRWLRGGLVVCLAAIAPFASGAREKTYPPAKVSFEDFKELVGQVERHRSERLIDFDTFVKMSHEPGVIVLDARSAFRYERIHLKGAKHLAFTDFTAEALAAVIPSFETRVLIYCNNNFDGNPTDFATKAAPRWAIAPGKAVTPASQMREQERPRMMALNIPTYINLWGYGYRNVYELDERVSVSDPRVKFEGSMVR